jgi:membrane dipeptidase
MAFPVADGHCDYLYGAVQSGYDLDAPVRQQIMTLADMEEGQVALQFFACWTDMTLQAPPLHQCLAMMDAYNRMLETHESLIPLDKTFSPENGKIATVLTIEGGEAIDGSLAILRMLYRMGARAMTMTWNSNNELAGAAMAKQQKGLTALGKDVIDEMCDLGMAIDVSHASDKTIDDILARATRPVFASHSNARSVYDTPRALKDEHIQAIAQNGGVIGVNFYYQQLSGRRRACIEDIVRHIKHIVEVGGIGACAIGSDFDGMQQYPVDLQSSRDFPALFSTLENAGFSQGEIRRIAYENLHDYIVQFV